MHKPELLAAYGRHESATKHPLPVLGSIQATVTSDRPVKRKLPLSFTAGILIALLAVMAFRAL